jgi:D-alanine-D-alanine ligase
MKTIGLFCGGYSSEFEISLKSAQTICTHFPKEYKMVRIIVSTKKWEVETDNGMVSFDLNDCSYFENSIKKQIDAGLIYIHGNPGENGKIQALLDMQNIPYINSGALASALSFDKWYCNQFLKSFDIPVAKSLFLQNEQQYSPEEIIEQLGLPIFIKPSDSGSSYGISKVKSIDEVLPALKFAFKEGKTVVIESFLDGIEVTCGVFLSTKGLVALPLTEIVSENEFFDYEAKYQGKSNEITPARISEELTEKVQESAKKIYQLLQLKSIARIDFMMVKNIPYVIEVNTTPGFSSESIVPKMLVEAGISITDFWKEITAVTLP